MGDKPIFEQLYASEEKLREFLSAMSGIKMGNFMAFANKFDFSGYQSLCDIGGAGGYLAALVAMNHDHMHCTSFDLPSPIATENIANMGLAARVNIQSGDFFRDEFPQADIITMRNILHDWGT